MDLHGLIIGIAEHIEHDLGRGIFDEHHGVPCVFPFANQKPPGVSRVQHSAPLGLHNAPKTRGIALVGLKARNGCLGGRFINCDCPELQEIKHLNGLAGRPVAEGTDLIAGGLKHVTNHWVYPLPVSVAERVLLSSVPAVVRAV